MRKRRQQQKKIIIIAGPNGAGKTTFAEEFLMGEAACRYFINADIIARELSPSAPEKAALHAGKIMLEEIANRTAKGDSFAVETTLSGRTYTRHILKWRRAGYAVKLIFLSLPSADVAVERVQFRVLQGGHYVAEEVIRRRFDAGIRNFLRIYRQLV